MRVSRVQQRAVSKETGYEHVKNFLGPLHARTHGMRNSNQILHEDQAILEENFYRFDHATCPG